MTQNRLRAGRAAMLATVALIPACSTSVVGTASPAGPTAQAAETADPSRPASAGPLDELLGRLALDDELGENLVVADLTGHPDGGAVLLARNGGSDVPDYVIRLQPTAQGLELGDVHEIPSQPVDADVNVAPDGTIVVTSQGEERVGQRPFRLFVVAPGAAEPEELIVTGLGADEAPIAYETVLSADGQTLYAGLAWSGQLETPAPRVVAIDVATGEVTATAELPFDVKGAAATVRSLALRPDGGLTAVILYIPDLGADPPQWQPFVVEFDAELGVVGEPVELVGDGETGRPRALQLTQDGAAVVSLEVEDGDTRLARMVVVREREVTDQFDLSETEEPPWGFALDPDDRYAYVPYGDESGQLVLGTLDLASGEVVGAVPLCPAVDLDLKPAVAALDVDAQTVTVAATCTETGLVEAFRVG